jgi:TRAP-type C4-dicarboxylate transport system permease small subunit
VKPPIWVRVIDVAVAVAVAVLAIMLAMMMIVLALDSLGRNVFRSPITGTTDLVSHLWMPALALLGVGYAQLRDEHIRVTIVTEKAAPAARRVLEIVVEVVGGLTALLLAILTMNVFAENLRIGKTAQTAPWLPLWPGQLLVVIGLAICALAAAARIYRLARGLESPQGDTEKVRDEIVG